MAFWLQQQSDAVTINSLKRAISELRTAYKYVVYGMMRKAILFLRVTADS